MQHLVRNWFGYISDIDDCMESPCNNGGTCKDGVASYICICPNGFAGQDCEISMLPICLIYLISNTWNGSRYNIILRFHNVHITAK